MIIGTIPIGTDTERTTIRLNHLKNTVECGFHSGIPACCIRFYVTVWLWLELESRSDRENSEVFKSYRRKLREVEHPGYIACPECISTEFFVKMKDCPEGVTCWHRPEQGVLE